MTRRFAAPVETGIVLALALLALYASLLPYDLDADRAPAPDLTYGLVAAWVIRRPGAAPLWAILGIGVAGDLLLSRPVGLGALGLLLAAEGLRGRAVALRNAPFLLEWMVVAALFAALQLAMHVALQLAFVDGPGQRPLLAYAAWTALSYPVIVLVLNLGPGIRATRRAPQPDRLGRLR